MWIPALHAAATVEVNGVPIKATVTAVCHYARRATEYQIEWLDSTGRPVTEWRQLGELSQA